ncbi:hypothetical protein [Bradyrhizobium sp. B117]|uniref:hypothetical protein n=1 Tax=Bradyrhizobium sp. B117 TaxID=3140246 RepID=UPI00318382A6
MPLAFPIEPATDEGLAGFVVRATATNFLRSPLGALSSIGIRTVHPGSLSSRSSALAASIAEWAGTEDIGAITRMFHGGIEGRKGWIDFFGEPLRAMYRQPQLRRVAPGALKNGDYIRAIWSLRPLSFDPATKELLIDSCPQCKRSLGWTRTYGVSYCEHCSRPEVFGQFTWYYPGLDLRDFSQSKIQVDDEEALDFLTGLIDPSTERKDRSRRLVPEMWSSLSAGDLFEVGLTFACMLGLEHWDKQQTVSRRKGGESWSWLTPRMLSIGGRAILGGQPGFEMFGDILRREAVGKPREKKYGKWAELGPLSIVEPSLCNAAKTILGHATEAYVAARCDPDMHPLQNLANKYGITRASLALLAESGLVPTTKFEGVKRAPTMMSEAALKPLLREKENTISAIRAAGAIGVHPAHMDELQKLGLLEKVEGAVLKLLKGEEYYTRQSVNVLKQNIQRRIARRAPKDCLRLRVAVCACEVRAVPWAGIVQSILDGNLEVFRIKAAKSRKSLGDRLAVRDASALASLVQRLTSAEPDTKPEWIGNAAASELLGINEVAVWRLAKAGALKKYEDAAQHSHFKRREVELLSVQMIFIPEVARTGNFSTYREASAWLKQHGITPRLELKHGGWKVYARAEVERALQRRVDELSRQRVPRSDSPGQGRRPDSLSVSSPRLKSD